MILSLHPTAYNTKPVALHGFKRTSVRRRWRHAHQQIPIRPRRGAETKAPHRIPAEADPPGRLRRSRAVLACDARPKEKDRPIGRSPVIAPIRGKCEAHLGSAQPGLRPRFAPYSGALFISISSISRTWTTSAAIKRCAYSSSAIDLSLTISIKSR